MSRKYNALVALLLWAVVFVELYGGHFLERSLLLYNRFLTSLSDSALQLSHVASLITTAGTQIVDSTGSFAEA